MLQSAPEQSSFSKTPLQTHCASSEPSPKIVKSSQELSIMPVTLRHASATRSPPCAKKPIGRRQLIFVAISRLMRVVTSQQMLCVVCVSKPLQKQTAGITYSYQIIHSCIASSKATTHYTREVTTADLKPMKSIDLFATIPISTKGIKPQRNGGAAPSRLIISSLACQTAFKSSAQSHQTSNTNGGPG